jgi:hypothetical protein
MKPVVNMVSVGPLRVMTILFSKFDLCEITISPKLTRFIRWHGSCPSSLYLLPDGVTI